MPELPEVETVRCELEKSLLGKVFDTPVLAYHPVIKTDEMEFVTSLKGKRVLSISRNGKYLIFHLSEETKLLFHLRMEGKLFVEKKEGLNTKHMTIFFPFMERDDGLAFYDVRKFGCVYYLKEEKEGPLLHVGQDPFAMTSVKLCSLYQSKRKPIKTVLMDQSLMSGIGNIYADEILFRSRISPFRMANTLTEEEIGTILKNAVTILKAAIASHGSTVKTYRASEHVKGSFQEQIQVYGKAGELCPSCHKVHIERRILSGRGTCYCPRCQKTGINVAITGKIASGKSLASHYFEEKGFARFSADEKVHELYQDQKFLNQLTKRFPEVFFRGKLSKKKITALLGEESFHHRYTSFLFRAVKDAVNDFIIANDGKNKIIEIPLLFDAHMEKDFTYNIGIETTKQNEHLLERGEDISRKDFNSLNSYDLHRDELDFILHSDGTKEELKMQVQVLIRNLTA